MERVPSNWRDWTDSRISLKPGPGLRPSAIRSFPVTNGGGTLYDETHSLRSTFGITDWYAWFTQEVAFKSDLILTDLPPNSGTSVQVQLTGTGAVSCGTLVLG